MNIVIMGLPAAGKDTVSSRLNEEFGLTHINMGAILREEKEQGTKTGLMVAKLIDAGHYVPDELVISIAKERIMGSIGAGRIFNGFPRTKSQAKHLTAFLLMRKEPLKGMIYLDAREQVAIERIKERGHKDGRPDDQLEIIKTRLAHYRDKTMPLLDYYSKLGLLNVVDANGTPEQVYQQVVELVRTWMPTTP